MKTIIDILKNKYTLTVILLSLFYVKSNAQNIAENFHFNVDWQMNAPINTDFANRISGWGMSFEGGYYVTPHWSLGAFISFHSNHKYVGRQTYPLSSTASLTTDQQQTAYQLPFGLSTAFRLHEYGYVRPYIGVKTGAMYARNTTYTNTTGWYDNPWGFYVSPEIGMNIYPVPDKRFGFHIAAYYSYATNKSQLLTDSQDGQNNVGFRVGICF
ncbi:outer membrane beta-barrel protein [uncultured Bacteroides sp.]|uniref:outer membrane beta-barrel protein n=1 Tax=uncultured Bacteroides sp. TaxID=162156 RepID=UPI0026764555|nr:outer membrane beta-barrel protein [uncultured Bacteroides sp.]